MITLMKVLFRKQGKKTIISNAFYLVG